VNDDVLAVVVVGGVVQPVVNRMAAKSVRAIRVGCILIGCRY
jgi:hypothetical protein